MPGVGRTEGYLEMKSIETVEKKFIYKPEVEVVVDMKIRELCTKPYVDHPFGCPNFGKKIGCPPDTIDFFENFEDKVGVVAVGFKLAQWTEIRRQEQPKWTDRALQNLRHWQPHVRSNLKKFISEINTDGFELVFNPEAMGVNMTKTCKNADIQLEWPPKNWVYQIALLGRRHI